MQLLIRLIHGCVFQSPFIITSMNASSSGTYHADRHPCMPAGFSFRWPQTPACLTAASLHLLEQHGPAAYASKRWKLFIYVNCTWHELTLAPAKQLGMPRLASLIAEMSVCREIFPTKLGRHAHSWLHLTLLKGWESWPGCCSG